MLALQFQALASFFLITKASQCGEQYPNDKAAQDSRHVVFIMLTGRPVSTTCWTPTLWSLPAKY